MGAMVTGHLEVSDDCRGHSSVRQIDAQYEYDTSGMVPAKDS